MTQSLADALKSGYGFTDASIVFGAALDGAALIPEPKVRLPLAMTNRHGLIAGATGTGKTRTLQLLAEQFSAAGVPVFVADIKGDLSGLAMPGESNDRVAQRAKETGWAWKPGGVPVEFVSLTGKSGVQLRATVSDFGPLLLAKVLGLNDTQLSVLTLVVSTPTTISSRSSISRICAWCCSTRPRCREGGARRGYGGLSDATVGVLLRKMIEPRPRAPGVLWRAPVRCP
jgi:hypothetical protein